MLESIRRLIGLYPKRLMANAYNPTAVDAAFARSANAVNAPFRDMDGSMHFADRFGALSGYQVPLPDDLKMKAGTVYPQGMQLITQPLWDTKSFTSASTTSLSFFNAVTSGVTGNMDLAGAISFPKSFIIRTIRFVPQLSNSFTSTGQVVAPVWNDISLLVYNSFHTLFVLAKQYLRAPSFMFPSGTGLGNTAAAGSFTVAAQIAAANFGMADPRATYTLLDRTVCPSKTSSDQWGKPEMATLNKQAHAVQLQRLSEEAPKGDATVRSHGNDNHENSAEMTESRSGEVTTTMPLWLETQVGFTYTVTWSGTQTIAASPASLTVLLDGQVIQPVQ